MPKHEASFRTRYSIEASYKSDRRSGKILPRGVRVPQDDKKKLYLNKICPPT
jgi:hypothetical protein